MTQQIINLGPVPNDGQGDNLRTAFDKTNENFDQIWTAGPVGSNVQIQGNTVSTLQVNQDLALSPNGTGNVRLNNNTIPGANNTWFLGSTTNRWRGLYVGEVTAANVTITNDLVVPGDVTIGGNLTVEGDTIQIGNIVTDTKTIQLANTAATSAAANGSGITVGANDNIATFLYNSTTNSWVTNLAVTYANGQPIGKLPGGSNTQIQFNDGGNFGGNANFTYNRSTGNFYLGGANLLAVVGNNQPYILQVPGLAFQGGSAIMEWDAVNQHVDVSNSFSIAGTLQLYGNYPGDGAVITTAGGSGVDITIEPSGNLYLNADGGEVIVSDQTPSINSNTGALKVLGGIGVNGNINAGGNITANYFVGNGSLLTGITSYANANAVAYGEAGWAGNIVPSGNLVYSLGNATNRWNDLYLAGNTIYLGAANISAVAGNLQTAILSVPGILFQGGNSVMEWDPTNQHVDVSNSFSIAGTLELYGNYPGDGSVIKTPGGSGVDITIEASGNLYLNADGGEVIVSDQTASVDSNTGALKVLGGIGVNGNINAGGNITGNAILGNITGLTGSITNLDSLNFSVENISALVGNNGVNVSAGGFNNLVVLPTEVLIQNVPLNTTGNISANYFIGDGSQLTGLPAGYTDADVATFLAAYGSNTISTTGNVTAGNFIGAGSNVELIAQSEQWVFDTTGNLTLPSAGYLVVTTGIIGSGASPAPSLSGFSSIATTGSPGNISASGNLLVSGYANITGNINGSGATFSGNVTAGNLIGNGSQLTAVNAVTVDVTNTNGLATTYYPTFVENRATAQIARADVDLSYRTDTNTLTVGNISSAGNITAAYFIGNGSALTGVTVNTVGNINGTSSNVDIIAGAYQWTFNNTGNLVLPGNTFAVNYANGTAVSLGGGGGSGTVTNVQGAGTVSGITLTGNVTTSGNLTLGGTLDLSSVSGNITTSGNISGGYILGNGSQLTGVANLSFTTVSANGTSVVADSTADTLTFTPGNNLVITGNATSDTVTFAVSDAPSFTGNVTAGNLITTGNVSGNVNGFAIGYRDIPVLSLAANTTVSTSDAGKQYYSTSASALTLTIANNASQAFQTGATINIINQGAGNVSVLRGVGVTMYLAGNSTSSDRTLTSYGVASVTKVATDTWFISGVGLI